MIEFHPAAESEMLDSAERYEREKRNLGRRFLAEVERVTSMVSDNPRIGAYWTYPTAVDRYFEVGSTRPFRDS